jgi:hypothetical protein
MLLPLNMQVFFTQWHAKKFAERKRKIKCGSSFASFVIWGKITVFGDSSIIFNMKEDKNKVWMIYSLDLLLFFSFFNFMCIIFINQYNSLEEILFFTIKKSMIRYPK